MPKKKKLKGVATSKKQVVESQKKIISDLSKLIQQARYTSARSVNAIMTATYWEIGRRIVEVEQKGKKKADYGENLIKNLDREIFDDIDLSSYALQIWNNAIKENPELEKKIKEMPNVVHSSKEVKKTHEKEGVLLFAKSYITNYLMHLDRNGQNLTENQFEILNLAKCSPDTSPLKRKENHYSLIEKGLGLIKVSIETGSPVGRLGNSRNPRRKLFEKLDKIPNSGDDIKSLADDVYHYPLLNDAESVLNKMFRRKEEEKKIIDYALERNKNETLLNKKEVKKMDAKPNIVCSMGLIKNKPKVNGYKNGKKRVNIKN